jgi:hypothetical protein
MVHSIMKIVCKFYNAYFFRAIYVLTYNIRICNVFAVHFFHIYKLEVAIPGLLELFCFVNGFLFIVAKVALDKNGFFDMSDQEHNVKE